eukprot:172786_1
MAFIRSGGETNVSINDIYSFRWGNVTNNIENCNKKQFIYVVSLVLDHFIAENIIQERSAKHSILVYLQKQRINGALFVKMQSKTFNQNIMQSGIDQMYLDRFEVADLYGTILKLNIKTISRETKCFLPNILSVPKLNDQSIAKLDTIVYSLKMSKKYQQYLQNTIDYRKLSTYDFNEKTFQLKEFRENITIPIVEMLSENLFEEINSNTFGLQNTKKSVRINPYLQICRFKLNFKQNEDRNYGNIKIYYKYSNNHEIKWNTALLYKGALDSDIEIKDNEALGLYNKHLFDVKTAEDIHPIYVEIDKNISLEYKMTITYANLQIENTMEQSMRTDVVSFTSDTLEYENNVAMSLDDLINMELLNVSKDFEISKIAFNCYLIPDNLNQDQQLEIKGNIKLTLYENAKDDTGEFKLLWDSYDDEFKLLYDSFQKNNVLNTETLNQRLRKKSELPSINIHISVDKPCKLGYNISINHSSIKTRQNDSYMDMMKSTEDNVHTNRNENNNYDDNVSFIPKIKCNDIQSCSSFILYLRQHQHLSTVSLYVGLLFVILAIAVVYALDIEREVSYWIAGACGIVVSLWQLHSFRTLLNKKKEIDVYSSNNKRFAEENKLVMQEVNKFSSAKDELKDTRTRIKAAIARQEINLQKFRQLNVNLEASGKENLELLANLQSMAVRMETKWKDQLFLKERKILHVCFDRFDWEDNLDGITQKQFTEFKLTLPMEYQLRLTRAGDWKTIAGDDGILQLDEFVELLDNFAQDVVTQQHEVRMSQTLDNDDLKEFQTFAPDTGNTNDNDND